MIDQAENIIGKDKKDMSPEGEISSENIRRFIEEKREETSSCRKRGGMATKAPKGNKII